MKNYIFVILAIVFCLSCFGAVDMVHAGNKVSLRYENSSPGSGPGKLVYIVNNSNRTVRVVVRVKILYKKESFNKTFNVSAKGKKYIGNTWAKTWDGSESYEYTIMKVS